MVLPSNEGLHISGGVKDGQKTGKRDIGEEEFVRVQGVASKETLLTELMVNEMN